MMTSRKKNESGLSSKGQRYWSLMLVGEHGRVIPFRRFKEVAIAIFAIALLSFAALVILGFFYIRQGQTIETLQAELVDLRQYASRLKDEKDVLNARLGIKKAQMTPQLETTGEKSEEAPAMQPAAGPIKAEAKKGATGIPTASKEERKPKPEKPNPPVVKWGADIRQGSVRYDRQRKILRAKFRVYNTSKPKKKLAGRTVVVFKSKADPPIKWFAVPNVLLSNGQPNGKVGQAFNINNFITMRHNAYGVKEPEKYDAAAVFVFSADGQLLASKETDFKIEPPPPPPPPKPAPVKAPSEEVPAEPPRSVSTDVDTTVTTGAQALPAQEALENTVQDQNATETVVIEPTVEGTATPADIIEPADDATDGRIGGNETTESEIIVPAPETKKPTP